MMMWPTKSIDMSWDDWLFALEAALDPGDRDLAAERVEVVADSDGSVVPCLMLRSAFDLFLRAQPWEQGDEIVFTAATVPAMPAVARMNGFVARGTDIDPMTGIPDPEALDRAVGPRTRAIVLTHLFGAAVDPTPWVEWASSRDLTIIEDSGQAYCGRGLPRHPGTDLALYSFGPMTTATALGGGLAIVRDASIAARMKEIQSGDPEQSDDEYLRRVIAYGLMKAASHPMPFGMITGLVEASGRDMDALVHRLTRNPEGPDEAAAIRQRPGGALLRLLERRLAERDRHFPVREAKGALLHEALGPGVAAPTRGAARHGYWMIPVLHRAPALLSARLREEGFFPAAPRLEVVGNRSPGAHHLVEDGVCIPFDPAMPDEELERLAQVVRDTPEPPERQRLAPGSADA